VKAYHHIVDTLPPALSLSLVWCEIVAPYVELLSIPPSSIAH